MQFSSESEQNRWPFLGYLSWLIKIITHDKLSLKWVPGRNVPFCVSLRNAVSEDNTFLSQGYHSKRTVSKTFNSSLTETTTVFVVALTKKSSKAASISPASSPTRVTSYHNSLGAGGSCPFIFTSGVTTQRPMNSSWPYVQNVEDNRLSSIKALKLVMGGGIKMWNEPAQTFLCGELLDFQFPGELLR